MLHRRWLRRRGDSSRVGVAPHRSGIGNRGCPGGFMVCRDHAAGHRLAGPLPVARRRVGCRFARSRSRVRQRRSCTTTSLHSLRLVVLGFAVASAVTGVPLGLLMGWSRRAEALINPVFLLIRPIPPLAWIPLAILWLGLGDAAKIMVIWFAAFVPARRSTPTRACGRSTRRSSRRRACSVRRVWRFVTRGAGARPPRR